MRPSEERPQFVLFCFKLCEMHSFSMSCNYVFLWSFKVSSSVSFPWGHCKAGITHSLSLPHSYTWHLCTRATLVSHHLFAALPHSNMVAPLWRKAYGQLCWKLWNKKREWSIIWLRQKTFFPGTNVFEIAAIERARVQARPRKEKWRENAKREKKSIIFVLRLTQNAAIMFW